VRLAVREVVSSIMRVALCRIGWAVAVGLVAVSSPAWALDPTAQPPADGVTAADENPADLFRAGTKAYFSGDKAKAVDAFGYAAGRGHPVAQWKLGRMYQDGDGVTEDDLKAFELFSQVANAHAEDAPHSPQAPFVASAFVELGQYYLNGIKDSAVKPNVARARELFTYAASYFGDAGAQYQLGRLYLEAEEDDRDPHLAARWLKLAAMKGHVGAQALLGQMLVSGKDLDRNLVAGLMWLTVARAHANPTEDDWIRDMQEEAFSVATEKERRRATKLADSWIAERGGQ
jgi:TPR repeat protein